MLNEKMLLLEKPLSKADPFNIYHLKFNITYSHNLPIENNCQSSPHIHILPYIISALIKFELILSIIQTTVNVAS
jgi:hypothetical protein